MEEPCSKCRESSILTPDFFCVSVLLFVVSIGKYFIEIRGAKLEHVMSLDKP